MKRAQITAAQTADLSPLQTAHAILFNGAAATLGGRLSADDEKTWIDAAQYALDTGDFGEIEDMLAEFDKWERYHAYAYNLEVTTGRSVDFEDWRI